MTRLQAKDFLITLGIAEPTEEAITNYLNNVNGELKKEKDRADAYKKESERTAELQKQLDELNAANLTDIEKANNATNEANNKIALLEKQIQAMNIKNSLIANGIKEDEANELVESFNGGNLNADLIGKIIADREKSAIADFEKASLAKTPNPKSGEPSGGEAKTEMDKAVEIAKSALAPESKSADIISAYA